MCNTNEEVDVICKMSVIEPRLRFWEVSRISVLHVLVHLTPPAWDNAVIIHDVQSISKTVRSPPENLVAQRFPASAPESPLSFPMTSSDDSLNIYILHRRFLDHPQLSVSSGIPEYPVYPAPMAHPIQGHRWIEWVGGVRHEITKMELKSSLT